MGFNFDFQITDFVNSSGGPPLPHGGRRGRRAAAPRPAGFAGVEQRIIVIIMMIITIILITMIITSIIITIVIITITMIIIIVIVIIIIITIMILIMIINSARPAGFAGHCGAAEATFYVAVYYC